MGNNVYLAGSGEMDNGLTVSMSFELDSGVDTGTGTGPFDNHYVEIASDALGTLRLSGHGGSSAQSAIDSYCCWRSLEQYFRSDWYNN